MVYVYVQSLSLLNTRNYNVLFILWQHLKFFAGQNALSARIPMALREIMNLGSRATRVRRILTVIFRVVCLVMEAQGAVKPIIYFEQIIPVNCIGLIIIVSDVTCTRVRLN